MKWFVYEITAYAGLSKKKQGKAIISFVQKFKHAELSDEARDEFVSGIKILAEAANRQSGEWPLEVTVDETHIKVAPKDIENLLLNVTLVSVKSQPMAREVLDICCFHLDQIKKGGDK